MSHKESLILFDFDGVFVDTINQCVEVMNTYNPAMNVEQLQDYFMGNIFHSLEKKATVKEPEGFDFQTLFRPKLLALKPYEGAQEFLKKLNRPESIIISSTRTDSISEFLSQNNMRQYFTDILGRDVERSKALKFQWMVDRFPGYELDFVTDTVGDIIEAENFNMRTIAVTWGYHDRKRLELAKPDEIVENYDELLTKLSENK